MKNIVIVAALLTSAALFGETNWENALSIKEVDQKPAPVKQDPPTIPDALKGTSGIVHVGFVIDAQGQVVDVKIIKSTDPKLDAVAEATVKVWEFKPAMNVGKAIPVRAIVPIRFN